LRARERTTLLIPDIEAELRGGTPYRDIARRHHVNQRNDIAVSERCY